MEKLSHYDPLALRAIEFNVKHVKKYTSVATILLSLGIIALATVITFDSLQHLWLPISRLPVSFSVEKYGLQPFTTLPVCVVSEKGTTLHPSDLMYSESQKDGSFFFKERKKLDSLKEFPLMEKAVEGKQFSCFDLEGILLDESGEQVLLGVANNISASIYIQAYDPSHYLLFGEPKISVHNMMAERPNALTMNTTIMFDMAHFTFKDSLKFNYNPTETWGLLHGYKHESTSFRNYATEYNYFSIQNAKTGANIYSYEITRKNVGQILSEYLAWQGLILMPLTLVFLLLPFVEIFFKVDLVKARYTAPELDTLDFSLVTDLRRRFAGPCELHEEKVLNAALERIDDELDLLQILRKQALMRRAVAELGAIEKPKDIFSCDFEVEANQDMLLCQDPLSASSQCLSPLKEDFNFEEEPPQKGKAVRALTGVVSLFDEVGTEVAIMSNGGKGYGSVWNVGALCLMSTGLVVGLLVMGLTSVRDNVVIQSCVASDPADYSLTIPKERILFRPVYSPFFTINNFSFNARIVDQDGGFIRTVPVASGAACGQPDEPQPWYCLGEDMELFTKFPQARDVLIRTTIAGSFLEQYFARTCAVQLRILEEKVTQGRSETGSEEILTSMMRWETTFLMRKFYLDGSAQAQTAYNKISHSTDVGSGFVFRLDGLFKSIQVEPASYWEVFDNAWGLTLLSFQIVIYRVCRAINKRAKREQVDPEREEQRSNILSVLNDIDRFSKGAYHPELASVKHYFKERLPYEMEAL